MSDFAVLRIAKITTLNGLSGASSHNARTANSGTDHADNHAPLMGGGVRLIAGQEDAGEAWHVRTQAVGLSKPRKDAVRALEAVMSVSPAWFSQASQAERQQWLDQSIVWATELFGQSNILSAYLHDDEETPHLHLLVVPLAEKARKKAGRPRKGREGQNRKTVLSWGLSAADYIGSPEKLVELQTQYAARLSDLGIRRGRPRRTTGSQHLSANTYRAQAADELADAKAIRSEALDGLTMAKKTEADAQISARATADAFTIGLDAIDQEELTYRPGNKNKREKLIWQDVEKPVLPTKTKEMWQWKAAVRPLFDALLNYARRTSILQSRNADLDVRRATLSGREKQLETDATTVSRMLKRVGQPTMQVEDIRQRVRQEKR